MARLPADAAPSAGTGRRWAAARPTPSTSSCMQHPGVGPGRGTAAVAAATPPARAEHLPVKGNAPHRPGARPVGSVVTRLPSRHTGSGPSVSIQAARSSRRGQSPPHSLITPRPGRELTVVGAPAPDTVHRHSSPTEPRRPPRARRAPQDPKTARKLPSPSAEGSPGTRPRGGLHPNVTRGVRGTRRLTSPVPRSAVRPVPVSTEHHYPYSCAQLGTGRQTSQALGQPG
ncbi:hypothetical protein L7F22_028595 [Adiantum nelumboides]|nr:hypothetical protein [Adiantum nelumboides]